MEKGLERYRLISEAGQGGAATVGKYLDTRLDRIVAIKRLRLFDSYDRQGVIREAQINAKLKHPNIVEVHDLIVDDDFAYIVMEWLPLSLRAKLDEVKRLPSDEAISFGLQLSAALEYTHRESIFHRDIKPENVLFSQDGVPKLADFGLSRLIGSQSYYTYGVAGTPPYMAPELFAQRIKVENSGDIYALGVMLFEIMCGELPIRVEEPNFADWRSAHANNLPLFPRELDLVPYIQETILLALMKDTADRYANIGQFLSNLTKCRNIEPSTSSSHGHDHLYELERKFPYAHYNYETRGMAYHTQGNYELAIDDYTQAIRIDPDYASAYANRGDAHRRMGKYQMAIDDYTHAVKIDPNHSRYYVERATGYFRLAKYHEAIEDCTTAIALNPDNYYSYYRRARAHGHLKHYQMAIDDYTEAIFHDPGEYVYYFNRGLCYYETEKVKLAIEDCSHAIRLKPDYSLAHYYKGFYYQSLSEYQSAIEDYSEAIRLNPKDNKAYRNRGYCHEHLGDNDLADDDYKKAGSRRRAKR